MQPAGQRPVDMRADQGLERMRELSVFALADHGPLLGQKTLLDDIGKQFRGAKQALSLSVTSLPATRT
jgi:hypothetical protein